MQSPHKIRICLNAEAMQIESALGKVERFLEFAVKQEVRPDERRRTATLRQQWRIQTNRRLSLISQLKQAEE